ncbi:hypothetical protein NW754_015529 [Fusarium falciforme]|uniref:Uncharacterized protein n=1 Tax=Fusarium falciforme TaxID=195108 RepID=A0A9W8QUY9_9HYPO|nr:hypothetical protein NW754_015529 [Fusarium falciforme]KAJ4179339.1 hypothetical protein NW755_012562 [Fusarium falciforme]
MNSTRSSVEPDTLPVGMSSSAWRSSALEAVSSYLFDEHSSRSEDASILLVLVSFFSPYDKIPLDLLVRGSTNRRRWTADGKIETVDAIPVGLVPELAELLSDASRLSNIFEELCRVSAILKYSDDAYHLNEDMSARIHESLDPKGLSFWRQQALIVAYRAIPWKYIEFPDPTVKLFLPHLQHVTETYQDCFDDLPTVARTDFMLTLIEASRFPGMAWKYFAVGQAELAAGRLKNTHLRLCIGQSKALLGRISGNMNEAVNSLQDLASDDPATAMNQRTRSEICVTVLQRCLNYIQVADLDTARELLEDWSLLGENPSPLEEVICFRKHALLGRIMRYQGEFNGSLEQLEIAHKTTQEQSDIILEEDLRDLTCDLADTLRELDRPVAGEELLRAEIVRRTERPDPLPGKSLLELALAESLFAQGRYEEAEQICLDVQTRTSLLKYERLRLYVILAKLRHMNSELESALSCWSEAMQALQKFPLVNGRVNRIISTSMADVLDAQGHDWLSQESPRRASLSELAKPQGVPYWIAGFRHWAEYLQSRGARGDL